jgi:hypothetical protein
MTRFRETWLKHYYIQTYRSHIDVHDFQTIRTPTDRFLIPVRLLYYQRAENNILSSVEGADTPKKMIYTLIDQERRDNSRIPEAPYCKIYIGRWPCFNFNFNFNLSTHNNKYIDYK